MGFSLYLLLQFEAGYLEVKCNAILRKSYGKISTSTFCLAATKCAIFNRAHRLLIYKQHFTTNQFNDDNINHRYYRGMLARLYELKLHDRIIWLIALLRYFGQHTKSTDLVNFFEASQKIWQDDLGIDVPQKIQDIYSSYLLTNKKETDESRYTQFIGFFCFGISLCASSFCCLQSTNRF